MQQWKSVLIITLQRSLQPLCAVNGDQRHAIIRLRRPRLRFANRVEGIRLYESRQRPEPAGKLTKKLKVLLPLVPVVISALQKGRERRCRTGDRFPWQILIAGDFIQRLAERRLARKPSPDEGYRFFGTR